MSPTVVPTAPSPEPTPEPTFQPTLYPTVTPAPTPGTPKPTLLPSLEPTGQPTLPPTPLPTQTPSIAPTTGDTAAVSVEFTLTSSLTPNNNRTAQLKATVEERVAADLKVSSVTVDDFVVTSVQTSARRRLGSGSGKATTRKLVAYVWTTSFTLKADLAAASLADHAALASSVTTTLTSTDFVSQASSRAKADVDTASVSNGVAALFRPTAAPTAGTLLAPTSAPVGPTPVPPTTQTTPAATPGSGSNADDKDGDDGLDAVPLWGIIAGCSAVLLIIGVTVVMWQKRPSLRAFQMRLLNNSVERAPTTMRTQTSAPQNEDDLEKLMRTEIHSTQVRDEAGLVRDTSLDRVTSTDERVTSTDSVTPTDESGLIRGTSMDSDTPTDERGLIRGTSMAESTDNDTPTDERGLNRGTSMDSVASTYNERSLVRGTSMDSVASSHDYNEGAVGDVEL